MDESLARWRSEKDLAFKVPGQSPLTPAQLEAFQALRYFPEQTTLRFSVAIEPYDDQRLVALQTGTGQPANYERYGQVRFHIDGSEQSLTAYRDPVSAGWFLPFRDATSGHETYGAGRYVELDAGQNGSYILDLNYAYNPFCAYNAQWTCPIPPAENHLDVPVRAGEMAFAKS